MLDVHQALSGDVSDDFTPYSHEVSLDHLVNVLGKFGYDAPRDGRALAADGGLSLREGRRDRHTGSVSRFFLLGLAGRCCDAGRRSSGGMVWSPPQR
jgi:hypothetical protein